MGHFELAGAIIRLNAFRRIDGILIRYTPVPYGDARRGSGEGFAPPGLF
jgi:hypothetical protein